MEVTPILVYQIDYVKSKGRAFHVNGLFMQAERGERAERRQKVFFCSHTNFLWRLSARYTQIESRIGSAREFFGGEKKSVGERKNF